MIAKYAIFFKLSKYLIKNINFNKIFILSHKTNVK